MGTANHIKSTNIRINKLSKTKYCPIAKLLRNSLKKIGKYDIPVLYFDEEPIDITIEINYVQSDENALIINFLKVSIRLSFSNNLLLSFFA